MSCECFVAHGQFAAFALGLAIPFGVDILITARRCALGNEVASGWTEENDRCDVSHWVMVAYRSDEEYGAAMTWAKLQSAL